MANISPNTTVGSLPSDMTIRELAREIKRMGLSGSSGDDDLDDELSTYNEKNETVKGINKLVSAVEKIGENIKGMDRALMGLLEPWRKVDEASAKYARAVGANVEKMNRMRDQAIMSVNKDRLGLKYGMSPEQLVEAQSNYIKGVGRQISLDRGDTETLAAITKVYGDATEWYESFDKLGVSMQGIGEHMGDMFATASKHGLSLSKYSENVKQGLAMANKYTFKDGLKGMEAMARRATAIRMDMQQVESFAESFSDIDKAISTSAKLQVLGGDFARGADPLGLLNDAIGDMEGMQKRFEGFLEGKASFNRETGTAEVSRYNRLRLNQFAAATGQDAGKVQEIAKRKAMLGEIEADLRRSANYSQIVKDEDLADAIRNTAVFKDGEFQIKIGDGYKKLADLGTEDKEELIKTTQDQSADIKDIAKHVRSLDEVRSGYAAQLSAVMAKMFGWLGRGVKNITKFFADGKGGGATQGVLHGLGAITGLGTAWTMFSLGRGAFKSGKYATRAARGLTHGSVGSSPSTISNLVNKFLGRGAQGLEGATVTGARGAQYTTYLRGDGTMGLRDSAGRVVSKSRSEKILANQAKKKVTAKAEKKGTQAIAKKTATKTTAKTVGKTVSKKAGTKAVQKGVSKAATKAGTKIATKAGTKLAAGIVKGGGFGIIGAAGDIATDMLVDSGKMKRGGNAHMAMKTGSKALEYAGMGAALGSILPGVGTAIGGAVGAAVGATVGAVQVTKARREMSLDAQLEGMGLARNGKYGAHELKKIDKALQTGELSDGLRRKLIREGDTELLNHIQEVYKSAEKEKREAKEAKKDKRAERWSKILGGPKNIHTAHFVVTNGIFEGVKTDTKKGFGVSAIGANPLLSLSPAAIAIRGVRELGSKIKFRKKKSSELADEARNAGNNQGNQLKVEFSGAINLKTPKGENIDILAEIKRNPAMLTQLTQMVMEEWNKQSNGGHKTTRMFGESPKMLWGG